MARPLEDTTYPLATELNDLVEVYPRSGVSRGSTLQQAGSVKQRLAFPVSASAYYVGARKARFKSELTDRRRNGKEILQ